MVRAIDVHIHPPGPGTAAVNSQMRQYFRSTLTHASVEEMVAYYQQLDIFGCLLTIDNESVRGEPPAVNNDYIAGIVNRYPRQFIGFGSVDPWQGKAG